MPEFSDIFIAKDSTEAIHYDIMLQNYPHITVTDITDYEISALWASLTNSRLKKTHELEFIDIDSDALLYQLPTNFTQALANLNDNQIIKVASLWAEYEDVPWRALQAQEKIIEIKNLAEQAIQQNNKLFLILV